MKRLSLILLALSSATSQAREVAEVTGYEPWPEEAIEAFESLPLQVGGRVMPASTFARFQLLALRAMASITITSGGEKVKIPATAWLMDSMFRPELAKRLPLFLVDNTDLLITLGVDDLGKRRDRFSYQHIEPGLERLRSLASQYEGIAKKDRSQEQDHLVGLRDNVVRFEQIAGLFAWAGQTIEVDFGIVPGLGTQIAGEMSVSRLLPVLMLIQETGAGGAGMEQAELVRVSNLLERKMNAAAQVRMIPPFEKDLEDWLPPGGLMFLAVLGRLDNPIEAFELIKRMEEMATARPGAGFLEALEAFKEEIVTRAKERGEYADIPTEVTYNRVQFFGQAKVWFVLLFLVLALTWLAPASRFGRWASTGAAWATLFPLGMLIVGIVFRSFIRHQAAPIHSLYDTILFITAFGVFLFLMIEWMTRRGVALALAPALGALGMFVASRYEVIDGADTMPQLQAVLDTSFWLWTHVTIINIGYTAGLGAGFVATVYLVCKFFAPTKLNREFFRTLTRMVYGIICFGLLFSLVGTVLGGIWANDSWGRFWGWDPKENGALMIVLWQLAILHARLGGFIKDTLVNIWAMVGAIIVIFSWWHVNQLGVGLHSYGFTSGIQRGLMLSYGFALIVIGLGVWVWMREKE
ncbi:MAG: cytochrome c biogenesis protein CcsA [Verrucomicrobiota bacterium]